MRNERIWKILWSKCIAVTMDRPSALACRGEQHGIELMFKEYRSGE